jgi:hypothetical protein
MDGNGNLFGTTSGGGSSNCSNFYGCGVLFKVTPSGQETVLHRFVGTDGANPQGGLLRDGHGNLFGTTFEGGNYADCHGRGCGVVFELTN